MNVIGKRTRIRVIISLLLGLLLATALLIKQQAYARSLNPLTVARNIAEQTVSDSFHYATHPGDLVRDVILGPSFDEAKEIASQSIQAFGQTLSQHERIADAILKENEHILSGSLSETTQQLSDIATLQQQELNTTLDRGVENLNVLLTDSTFQLTETLQLFAVLLFAAVLVGAFAVYVALKLVRGSTLYDLRRSIFIGCISIALITVLSWIVVVHIRSVEADDVWEQHLNSFNQSLLALNLTKAVLESSDLEILRPDLDSTNRSTLASIMRSVLTDSSAYKAGQGLQNSLDEIGLLRLSYWQSCKTENPYLDSLEAMITWQSARDRDGEYKAALRAASALDLESQSEERRRKPTCYDTVTPSEFSLWPLAENYLANYLVQPLTKAEREYIAQSPGFSGDLSDPRPQRSNQELAAILKRARLAREQSEKQAPIRTLAPFTFYGTVMRHVLRETIPSYVVIAYSAAMQGLSPDIKHRAVYAAASVFAANRIKSAYTSNDPQEPGLVAELSSDAFNGTPFREVTARSSHIEYYRALKILQSSSPVDIANTTQAAAAYLFVEAELRGESLTIPSISGFSFSLPAIALIPDDQTLGGFPTKDKSDYDSLPTERIINEQIEPTLRPFAYAFLEQEAFDNFKADLARLQTFEVSLKDFLGARAEYLAHAQNPTSLKNLLSSGATLVESEKNFGFFVCSSEDLLCESDDVFEVAPLDELLFQSISSAPGSADLLKQSLGRQVLSRHAGLI